jgi:exodeoxyribonuclease VII large subunit
MPVMQLDFDLHAQPPKPPEPKIHSVGEITRRIRQLLEGGIGAAWVEGEISNLRVQSSGHRYFTLKDSSSQLPCVLFSRDASALRGVNIADGMQVQVYGELSVYEPRGQYQMIVRTVHARGAGALQARFEALKKKLADEGLFDQDRKRPIPPFPATIGVITSPTGAAIRDFLTILHRRQPAIRIIINPVRVQGTGAAAEIAEAIRLFGRSQELGFPTPDVLVVTRGGGSLEDLWEFNEESVARAIAESRIPVVSAVGHEIDFTIADFAADLRAPTPSGAAEFLAADRKDILAQVNRDAARLNRAILNRFDLLTSQVAALRQSPLFREPQRRIAELRQTMDRMFASLSTAPAIAAERRKASLHALAERLSHLSPRHAIQERKNVTELLGRRASEAVARRIAEEKSRVERLGAVIATLSPTATLQRGFSMTLDAQGNPLKSATEVEPGMRLRTKFHDGEVESTALTPPSSGNK